jgi:hypothetical protein
MLPSPTTGWLYGVWGTSASDVYAVGYDAAALILHYDGASWSSMANAGYGHLNGVWGSSATDVYAVGSATETNLDLLVQQYAVLAHYDGASWSSTANVGENDLDGVWGSSPSDVFVAGLGIWRYDGSSWSPMTLPNGWMQGWLSGVWGSSASDVFATGLFMFENGNTRGVILHYGG